MSLRPFGFLFLLFSCLFASLTVARAQTRPRVQVPTEDSSQANAIIQQLLRNGRIIRPSEVKRGMKGFGRSVFQGTTIEEFPIEVIGVLERVQGGGDIVLIRVTGGTVVKRNSGIVAGMSGSPVYINGKMLGAIALGWGFPKEPIGGVTPIAEMIRTSLPDSAHPAKSAALPAEFRPKAPLHLAGREIERMVVSRDPQRVALAGPRDGATMTMRPATTLLQISGMRQSSLPLLRRIFDRYQLEPVIGPSSQKTVPSPPLKPGSAMGVQLVSGDMDQTAVGTVTFRWGDRILGFGHPMFGQGAASIPLASTFVHDIFPSYQRSFKLASPIKVVGALQQDTQFAVGGTLGTAADTIPMSVSLSDPARKIRRAFHVRVMKDPVLTPQLIGAVAGEAIETTLGLSSDKMVKVGMAMEIDGAPRIVRHNLLYTQGPITPAALADLRQTLTITQSNEFARGSIRRVDLSVSIDDSRRLATIKSMVANRNKVRAGETVQISVQLEPIATPHKYITRTFNFKVPADAPDGQMRVAALPGTAFWSGQVRVGGAPPEPSNLQELVAAWNRVGAFNELLVQASTPQKFLQVDNKKLPNPPSSWAGLLRGARSTSVAAYNEVETQRVSTQMALTGAQFLTIPVESTGYHERADEDNSSFAATGAATGAPSDDDAPAPAAGPADEVPSVPVPSGQSILMGGGFYLDDSNDWIIALGQESTPRRAAGPATAHAETRFAAAAQLLPRRDAPNRPLAPAVVTPTPTPSPTPKPTGTPRPTATPTPTPKPTARTLARPAKSWVQESAAEFLKGEIEDAIITNRGDIRPAPPSRLLATTSEPFIWSIAGDSSRNVYLGTSNPARILRVNDSGQQAVFYKSSAVAVNALTSDSAGHIYAGLSPGGQVLRFDSEGRATPLLDLPVTYIWALEWDAQGRLLIATGGEHGALYRLDRPAERTSRATLQPLAQVPQHHVRAVAARGDELFLGTGDEGVLWRRSADGTLQALYQAFRPTAKKVTAGATTPAALVAAAAASSSASAAGGEILAVAATPEGVYFGTSTSGTLYRWNAGHVEELYPSPQKAIYAIRRAADGALYIATGDNGVVYQVYPGSTLSETRAARLLEPEQRQSLALALTSPGDAPDGTALDGTALDDAALLIGTGNNGAAYRIALQAKPAGVYTSPVFDAQDIVRWGALRFIGSGVAMQTRSGNTREPDASWSDWQTPATTALGELQIASSPARYLQYRARLESTAGDSHLARVEAIYRARNSAPQVALQGSPGGSYWSGKQTLKWAAQDADQDPLHYRLWLSPGEGENWKEVKLAKDTSTSFVLDTTQWPDGVYRLKLEASDAERNPEDPLRAEDISRPLIIDNTDPAIVSAAFEKMGEDGALRLRLVATDALSPIAGAEWRWQTKPSTPPADEEKGKGDTSRKNAATPSTPSGEGTDNAASDDTASDDTASDVAAAAIAGAATGAGEKKTAEAREFEWHATAAEDGIFDSRRETALALLPSPARAVEELGDATSEDTKEAPAPTAIEVRVHDGAGNSATQIVPLP